MAVCFDMFKTTQPHWHQAVVATYSAATSARILMRCWIGVVDLARADESRAAQLAAEQRVGRLARLTRMAEQLWQRHALLDRRD